MDLNEANRQAAAVEVSAELDWLEALTESRLTGAKESPAPPPAPSWAADAADPHAHSLRIAGALSLVSAYRPSLFDRFHREALSRGHSVMEFGILRFEPGPEQLPTLQTAVFLSGVTGPEAVALRRALDAHAYLLSAGMLLNRAGQSAAPAVLQISEAGQRRIFQDGNQAPEFSPEFPAQPLHTTLEWEDLVLPPVTLRRVEEILDWMAYGDKLGQARGIGRRIAPGFRALFHGPPGTGKSLTAGLLGKRSGKPVYRIDLSLLVSKYIGETEKNLARIFDRAEQTDWILFFDEADSVFGKRTQTRHSNDRYANQEVSYLLQRVEAFPGVVILASNFRKNIDAAFSRRFQTVAEFPAPDAQHRLRLWEAAFDRDFKVAQDVELKRLAEQYKLTGAEIINAVRFAALRSLRDKAKRVSLESILEGIAREFEKEGKIMPAYIIQERESPPTV